ncbi:unnamed protein product, partial [Chrysoparadoxa australica]
RARRRILVRSSAPSQSDSARHRRDAAATRSTAGLARAGRSMSDDKRDQRSRRRKLFGAGLRTLGRGARRVLPGYDRAQYWTQSGLDWFDTLGNLKGAAMKLGQVAAQYQDLLPPELTEQLARLQRDAQPRPFEQMRTVLDAAWGPDQWAKLDSIDETAMAAASIGQVHRARLADGRAVVVKIR